MANGWEIPPLCKVKGCEMPSQIYSKKTMNSNGKNTYLKTCRRHTYKDIETEKK